MNQDEENLNTGTGLPENAFRELGADEQYVPVMHPARDQKEVTPYSVATGLIMAIIFSAAVPTSDSKWARYSRPQSPSPSLP